MSRRLRAVLIGTSLFGIALLMALDRRVATPRRSLQTNAPGQSTGHDLTRYHAKTFVVTEVIDGDTLCIDAPDAGAPSTRIRLLGIDAPEFRRDEIPQMHFARQAADHARQLVRGGDVTVYLDAGGRSRGTYGRLLAYVEMPDGRFLNEVLLAEGYAYADLRFAHSYYYRYRQLEASARALKEGLWAAVTSEEMPLWRQNREAD